MKYSVIICSTGRKIILHDTIKSVLKQQIPPEEIIVSVPSEDDVLPETLLLRLVKTNLSERGLTRQRNSAAREVAGEASIVMYFDDDVEVHPAYCAKVLDVFEKNPNVVLATGGMVADGARHGGIEREKCIELLEGIDINEGIEGHKPEEIKKIKEAHGSNMCVRKDVLLEEHFDERLPLYGWHEDTDFSIRCARHGDVILIKTAKVVHMGVPSGRISQHRFGYSQIVNPIYLWRKGSFSVFSVAKRWSRAVLSNTLRIFVFDKRIDRWGRLKGNMKALLHVASGEINPEYILRMK